MVELEFIDVDGGYGANQDRLATHFQRLGGCGALTAADACIYLSRTFPQLKNLYEGPTGTVSQEGYQAFFDRLKPYLHPRVGGISKLETFTDGLGAFAKDRGVDLEFRFLRGGEADEKAEAFVRQAIDERCPVAFLLLLHDDPALEDITWHWFLLTGYEDDPDGMTVQFATYGKRHWLSFRRLWNTGHPGQGGMVCISAKKG